MSHKELSEFILNKKKSYIYNEIIHLQQLQQLQRIQNQYIYAASLGVQNIQVQVLSGGSGTNFPLGNIGYPINILGT